MDYHPALPATVTEEKLFQLQLKVAQRADEIARRGNPAMGGSWRCWTLAESEVLVFEAGPIMVASRRVSA
jgi:hypothetical protein